MAFVSLNDKKAFAFFSSNHTFTSYQCETCFGELYVFSNSSEQVKTFHVLGSHVIVIGHIFDLNGDSPNPSLLVEPVNYQSFFGNYLVFIATQDNLLIVCDQTSSIPIYIHNSGTLLSVSSLIDADYVSPETNLRTSKLGYLATPILGDSYMKLKGGFYYDCQLDNQLNYFNWDHFPKQSLSDLFSLYQKVFQVISKNKKFIIPLSSGFDSRLLTILAQSVTNNISAYTYGVSDSKEFTIASRIASLLRIDISYIDVSSVYPTSYHSLIAATLIYSKRSIDAKPLLERLTALHEIMYSRTCKSSYPQPHYCFLSGEVGDVFNRFTPFQVKGPIGILLTLFRPIFGPISSSSFFFKLWFWLKYKSNQPIIDVNSLKSDYGSSHWSLFKKYFLYYLSDGRASHLKLGTSLNHYFFADSISPYTWAPFISWCFHHPDSEILKFSVLKDLYTHSLTLPFSKIENDALIIPSSSLNHIRAVLGTILHKLGAISNYTSVVKKSKS